MDLTKVAHSSAFLERFIEDLAALVAIPSVSTSPKHEGDIRAAGDWVMQQLSETGMGNVRLLESPRHPSVFAEWKVDDAAPTVLIYGHYDVQPAEPLELWDSPPFELTDKGSGQRRQVLTLTNARRRFAPISRAITTWDLFLSHTSLIGCCSNGKLLCSESGVLFGN